MFSFMRSDITSAYRMRTWRRSRGGPDGEAFFTQGGGGQDPRSARRAGREDAEHTQASRGGWGLDGTAGAAARAGFRGIAGALFAMASVHDLFAAALRLADKKTGRFWGGRLTG